MGACLARSLARSRISLFIISPRLRDTVDSAPYYPEKRQMTHCCLYIAPTLPLLRVSSQVQPSFDLRRSWLPRNPLLFAAPRAASFSLRQREDASVHSFCIRRHHAISIAIDRKQRSTANRANRPVLAFDSFFFISHHLSNDQRQYAVQTVGRASP